MNASPSCLRRLCLLLSALLFALSAHASDKSAPDQNGSNAEWAPESNSQGVAIQSRLRQGTDIREFKAVGAISATPATVFAILDDCEAYPRFMPYTSEVRVLKREKNATLAYQRLELPLVSDRDYTLRSQNSKWLGPDGAIYHIRWAPANDEGPAVKSGVARVNVCEGGWLLEPDGAGGTRATYSIFTDSGGAIPAFIANNGSRMAIRKLFEALRKRAKDPQFAATNKVAARSDVSN